MRPIDTYGTTILQYLNKHGQGLDYEIAAALEIPLTKVRAFLADLSARGEITSCSVTRFNGGKAIVGMLCRVSGFIPPSAPGPKPGFQSKE